jgi:hypothetical protein
MLEAGEAVADITPPPGVEMAGFHKPPGRERVITGIRQPAAARALVLRTRKTSAALVSLDLLAFDWAFTRRVQRRAARQTGIPPGHIRVCGTHSHSMPTLRFLRQWGAVPKDYAKEVEDRAVQAIAQAKADLAPADLYLGRERVVGGNFNRASAAWKTDAEFGQDSTDRDRWLDTMLHALYFQRERPRRCLLWYHFSAHPVCYDDDRAGPDWPGLVAAKTEARDGLQPGYLQGHCGDVNPGDGQPWRGDAERVSEAVWTALHHATNHSQHVPVDDLRVVASAIKLPLDVARLKDQLDRYRKDPAACTKGEWVDAGFARDWFTGMSQWQMRRATCLAPLSAMRVGDVAILFHPAELYSVYGLSIRRDSPFPHTIVVGYADDVVGYVTDPTAYEKGEYAALVVPKILDLPPFKPEAGRELTAAALALLKKLA